MNIPKDIEVPIQETKYCTEDALAICRKLYEKLKSYGLFIGLTGGTLYKEGNRKDIDLILYRHRQVNAPLITKLYEEVLKEVGFRNLEFYGFVTKAEFNGIKVDILNPEDPSRDGKY